MTPRSTRGPALASLLLSAVCALILIDVGHSALSVTLLAVYWGWVILLPGVIICRATLPASSGIVQVGIGGVIGLALELVLRPVSVLLGEPLVVWLAPLLVAPLAFSRGARERMRRRATEDDGRTAAWTALAAVASVVALWFSYLRHQPVPTAGGSFYQDLMFHLAITRDLQAEVWPSDPQIAGMPLEYHWFANSHQASLAAATGLEPAAVVFHLWLVPLLLLTAVLISALTAEITSRWWLGPVAIALTFLGGASLMVDPRIPVRAENGVEPLSPSQMIATPVFMALLVVAARLLRRGNPDRAGWLVFVGLAILAAGTKPTVLPMLAAGLVAVVAWGLLNTRRLSGVALLLLIVVVAVAVVTGGVLVGSTGGSSISPLGILRGWPLYDALTGDTTRPGSQDLWLDAFSTPEGLGVAVTLVLAFLAVESPRWLGLLAVFHPLGRKDPVIQLLSGAAAAGWLAFLLLDHPGQSQIYFLFTLLPVCVVLLLWLGLHAVPLAPARVVALMGIGLAGAVVATCVRELWTLSDEHVWLAAFAVPTLVGMVAALSWPHERPRFWLGLAGASVALATMTFPLWAHSTIAKYSAPTAQPSQRLLVSDQEVEAAQWIDRVAHPDDVVATNVHCLKKPRGRCDARGFWVAALTGQRVLLGGWAYSSLSMSSVEPGTPYAQAEAPFPRRLELGDRAVARGSATALRRLSERGVRWLFADRAFGRVSPALQERAVLRYENGSIQVFELNPPK